MAGYNNNPYRPQFTTGYQPFSPYTPGGYSSAYSSSPMGQEQGGGDQGWGSKAWDWLGNHLGDVLNFGGNVLQGYTESQQGAANRAMSQEQFNQTLQQRQREWGTQTAMDIQNRLNRAPVADKAQYLAMNAAPPMPFQPRDYTQGLNNIRGQAQGGAAAQLAANASASANYKAGMGGVDTETLKSLLARITGGAQGGQNPGAPAQQGPASGATPGDVTSLPQAVAKIQYPAGFFPAGLPDKPALSLVAQEWQRLYGSAPMPWPLSSKQAIDWWQAYRAAYNATHQGGGG